LAGVRTAVVASTIWAPAARAGPSVTPFGVTTGDLTGASDIIISDPLPVDIFIYRGDSGRFRVEVTAPDGGPLDITAATWDCDIRSTHDAQTVVVSLEVTQISATTVEVVIDSLKSALLIDNAVWDLEMTLNGEVQTLMAGTVHVHKDVSRQ
jgi:hypothetical protein